MKTNVLKQKSHINTTNLSRTERGEEPAKGTVIKDFSNSVPVGSESSFATRIYFAPSAMPMLEDFQSLFDIGESSWQILLIWHPFGPAKMQKCKKFQKQDKQTRLILIHFIQFSMFHSFPALQESTQEKNFELGFCVFYKKNLRLVLLTFFVDGDQHSTAGRGEEEKQRRRKSMCWLSWSAGKNETCQIV